MTPTHLLNKQVRSSITTGTIHAVIAGTTSLSPVLDLTGFHGQTPLRCYIPGTWTAANLSFQVSYDGTAFFDLYDQGAEIRATAVAANYAISLRQSLGAFAGVQYLKVRSGVAGTAVNQAATRTIVIECGDV